MISHNQGSSPLTSRDETSRDDLKSVARLIVIPGFLNERDAITRILSRSREVLERVGVDDPTASIDERAWLQAMCRVTDPKVKVEVFSWASQSLAQLVVEVIAPLISLKLDLSRVMSFDARVAEALLRAKGVWDEAVRQSEASVERLIDRLQAFKRAEPSDEIYLIGHSLGGRIALRVAERLASASTHTLLDPSAKLSADLSAPSLHLSTHGHSPIYVSAWAPAISRRELEWESLETYEAPPEIYFSQADSILKLLFPLGQAPIKRAHYLELVKLLGPLFDERQRAVGLIGPGSSAFPTLDLSEEQMRHAGYLLKVESLMRRSVYLNKLVLRGALLRS